MPDKCESQRDNIRRLYVGDDLTRKQLVVEMKRLYDFEANEKEYQRRVRKWGLRKGLKQEEWNFVGRRFAKRKAEEGKDSELIVNGNAFPQHKIRKALGRHYFEPTYEHFQREMAVRRSQTPKGLFITTPPRQRSLTPVNRSATISVNDLPYSDFLRVLERHGPLFEQLANSLSSASHDTAGPASMVLRRFKTALSMKISELAPLARWGVRNSCLIKTFKNVKPENQQMFMTTVLATSNNQWQDERWERLYGYSIMTGFDFHSGKVQVLSLFREKNPVVESLVETLFKAAIQANQVNLVQLLLKHTQVGPNDPLGYYRPLDVAIRIDSTAMTFALLNAGAHPAQSRAGMELWAKVICEKLSRSEFQSVLDRGFLDEPRAIRGVLRTGDRELIASILERVTPKYPLPESSLGLVLHWAIECNRQEVFEKVMKSGARFTQETLFAAISDNAYHFISLALKRGMYLDFTDACGKVALSEAICFHKIQAMRVLLGFGLDSNMAILHHLYRTPTSLLHEAVDSGSGDMVKLLLKKGANINVWDKKGLTPLCHAIYKRKRDIATYLVDWGADIERPTRGLIRTPLQIATMMGDSRMVKVLLERGADVNSCVSKKETALLNAINSQMLHDDLNLVRLLIDAGADVNAMRGTESSPLSRAFDLKKNSVVQLLLEAGASPIDVCALGCATFRGDVEFINIAISTGLDVDATNERSKTTLETMFVNDWTHRFSDGNINTLEYLLDRGADPRRLRLPMSFQRSYPKIARRLSENGAHRCGSVELDEAFEERDCLRVERILKHLRIMQPPPVDIDDPCFGHRYLNEAVKLDNSDMVRALVHGCIDVSPPCVVEAVSKACASKNLGVVKCLVEAGAPVDDNENNEGWLDRCLPGDEINPSFDQIPPLQAATVAGAEEVVRFLLQFPKAKTDNSSLALWKDLTSNESIHWQLGGGPNILRLLHDAGVDIYGSTSYKTTRTALQDAASLGDSKLVECLIQLQADVNEPPYKHRGMSALQASAIKGHIEVACMLLSAGADVNATGAEWYGRTALEGAAEWGRLDTVKLLLQHGADINSPGFGERQFASAVKLAREAGHNAVARLIESHRGNQG